MRTNKLANTQRFYLTDGGLETFMVFNKGHDLPCFSAAALLDTQAGRSDLNDYYETYIGLARATGRGFLIDAPTWRAGVAWAEPLGLSIEELLDINRRAVAFVSAIRDRHESDALPIVLNGLIGPAGDAYAPGTLLSEKDAFDVHAPQVHALGKAGVDMISAMTLTHAEEACGIAQAAKEIDVPIALSFTLETDGRLPSGQPLGQAIEQVDEATGAAPLYYMINCAHPDHFSSVLDKGTTWTSRVGGIRCNASRMSHAELDDAEELDDGDPIELGELSMQLLQLLPNIRVVGGCCGTDHRHVGCMAHHHLVRSAA
ncbi:MAG: homocysteine S-methyltransferase family protein [Hyphomicrobiales bacterium]